MALPDDVLRVVLQHLDARSVSNVRTVSFHFEAIHTSRPPIRFCVVRPIFELTLLSMYLPIFTGSSATVTFAFISSMRLAACFAHTQRTCFCIASSMLPLHYIMIVHTICHADDESRIANVEGCHQEQIYFYGTAILFLALLFAVVVHALALSIFRMLPMLAA